MFFFFWCHYFTDDKSHTEAYSKSSPSSWHLLLLSTPPDLSRLVSLLSAGEPIITLTITRNQPASPHEREVTQTQNREVENQRESDVTKTWPNLGGRGADDATNQSARAVKPQSFFFLIDNNNWSCISSLVTFQVRLRTLCRDVQLTAVLSGFTHGERQIEKLVRNLTDAVFFVPVRRIGVICLPWHLNTVGAES